VLTIDLLTEIADGLTLPDPTGMLIGLAPAAMPVRPSPIVTPDSPPTDHRSGTTDTTSTAAATPYLPEIVDDPAALPPQRAGGSGTALPPL
jgi:hypothetical protein